MLTMDYLNERFDYDPNTGELSWKTVRSNRVRCGQIITTTNSHGYIIVSLDNKRYPAHRIIWMYVTGEMPNGQIDHINGVRNDNRWVNLRDVSRAFNQQNRNTTIKMTGASWNKLNNNWKAQISTKNGYLYLGSFNTQEEAHAAYLDAKKKYHLGWTGR